MSFISSYTKQQKKPRDVVLFYFVLVEGIIQRKSLSLCPSTVFRKHQ